MDLGIDKRGTPKSGGQFLLGQGATFVVGGISQS